MGDICAFRNLFLVEPRATLMAVSYLDGPTPGRLSPKGLALRVGGQSS